jgi:hypothetical protein
MKYKSTLIFLCAIVLTVPDSVAQQNQVLPDLAPQIVEITGELSISFPSIRRQPLIGFNPPPRVPDIPEGRRPFTEAYKQPSAQLPPSPLKPPSPPQISTVSRRQSVRGTAELGSGRFFERFGRAAGNELIDANTSFIYSASYRATDGIEPFSSDPSISSASNKTALSAGLRRRIGSLVASVDASYDRNGYSLFGAVPEAGSLNLKNPRRTVSSRSATLSVGTQAGSRTEAQLAVSVGSDRIETRIFDPKVRLDPRAQRQEDRVEFTSSFSSPVAGGRLGVDARGLVQGLDRPGIGRTISSGSAALAYTFEFNDRLTVRVGARVLAFDASAQGTSGADRTLSYLSPDIRLDYRIQSGLSVFLSNSPTIERATLASIYEASPYAQDRFRQQPEIIPTNLKAGVDFYSDNVHGSVSGGWQDIRNIRYFENNGTPRDGYVSGYFDTDYQNASIFRLDGITTASLTTDITTSVFALYRYARLDRSDVSIPYLSPVQYGLSTHIGLFDGTVALDISAVGENYRYTNRTNAARVGSVFRVSGNASYFFSGQAGMTVGIRNAGGSQLFWDNYEPESNVLYAGLRWRW